MELRLSRCGSAASDSDQTQKQQSQPQSRHEFFPYNHLTFTIKPHTHSFSSADLRSQIESEE
jgi:hypothetical protein